MTTTAAPAATSFGPVRQTVAGVLDVGYVDADLADGRAVVLLHGWPYDIHSYAEVAPALAAAGFRRALRGYGSTNFLSRETARTGQQSALAIDVIELMASGRRSSVASTGARGRRTSSLRSGRSDAGPWSRSAAT